MNPLLVYTMTSGLGDYIIMGDLMRKVETLIPKSRCVMIHRNNFHINLWEYDKPFNRFFNIYNPAEVLRLISFLKKSRDEGFTVFGLQMAPGSMQGFLMYYFMKKLKIVDYIVDFNLINADIITPPEGDYILDLHLNQIKDLFKISIPPHFYKLDLPINLTLNRLPSNHKIRKVGIHPWSRRGHLSSFVWPVEKWLEVIKFIIARSDYQIVIFGKDSRFVSFAEYIKSHIKPSGHRVIFIPCNSVHQLVEVIYGLDLLLTVNTSVIHIGYAFNKRMIILSGPSLNIWIPKGEVIYTIYDEFASFPGSDKHLPDERFPSVSRIDVRKVLQLLVMLLEGEGTLCLHRDTEDPN